MADVGGNTSAENNQSPAAIPNQKTKSVTMLSRFCVKLNRTKRLDPDMMQTPLKRCLTTLDISLLGIGHMVGAGVYVLTGEVAQKIAGPGIVLSFILAGVTSLLSALCYAEFGARVPKAGSAYVYTYVTIGEFWAFVIGWNIVLEHMIGAASVARAWSGYFDSLFGGVIQNFTSEHLGHIHADFFGRSLDLVAFALCIAISVMMALGVKGSTNVNSVFTVVNMAVIVFVIVFGFYFAHAPNWTTDFLPFGAGGVVAGAATCFYAFVGFDSIATAGEEAQNPSRSIPIATVTSMGVVMVAYICVSSALTLMVPYYEINPVAALPDAFSDNGAWWAKYVVAVGALCGMTTTLFGGLFALPRTLYAMSSDGLFFQIFGRVHEGTQLPVINLLLSSFMTAVIALLFDIEKLVEFMSIGTLMAYTIVSASVIILRYQPSYKLGALSPDVDTSSLDGKPDISKIVEASGRLKSAFFWLEPILDCEPGTVVTASVLLMTIFLAAFCALVQLVGEELTGVTWWAVLLATLLVGSSLLCFLVICMHEQNKIQLHFKVPLVPLLPVLSIFFNVGLMTHLHHLTWVRFFFWMVIGLMVYFLYGIHHSRENEPPLSYAALLISSEAQKSPWGAMQETLHHPQGSIRGATNDKQPIIDDDFGDE